ncbi:hypothetical protein PVAND_016442 [Polypedilum vanderplanki]|uniref:F-box domain-containing protein n=1 Tax=Polypedilum vanderplanki TaxID=319348 RepID=A0A9J6BFX2_POLVA|nr:hypothetical protein PVAND_016442 [Polypedilum vanderplanki]
MNELPNEILLKIFSQVSSSDLINLTSQCYRFNEIISKSELAHKLTLYFRKLNPNDDEIIRNRKYQRLKIGFFKPQLHTKIVQEIGASLRQLEFAFCKLKLDIVRRVLCLCPNVKDLKFVKIDLSDVPNRFQEQPLPVLLDVDVKMTLSDPRIFKVLSTSVVTAVTMDHKYRHASGNVSDFTQFLLNQSELKELTITDFFRTNLFLDTSLNNVAFRLTTLRIKDVNLVRTDFFKIFLENNHLESLETLEVQKLEKCNLTPIIGNCKFLKRLKFDATNGLNDLEELPNLEILTLFAQLPLKLNQLIHKFPSLREVEMHYCRLSYDEEEFMNAYGRISHPDHLTTLRIIDTTVARLKTKTIKILMLKNVKICENFFENNQNIEELHVENCDFNDDVLEAAITYQNVLKKLTIIGENITQKTIDRIADNC